MFKATNLLKQLALAAKPRLTITPARCLTSAIMTPRDQAREFMAVFPDIIRDISESSKQLEQPEATKWLSEVLQYNVPGGKKNRGITLITSYKLLEEQTNLTPENIRMAIIMGWCVEMFQAFHLILEDLMDGAQIRRGLPCWHKRVGLSAINDAILVQMTMYSVLKKYFLDKPYYLEAIHVFNDMTAKTSTGQLLDMQLVKENKPDISKFTMKYYDTVVKYKTCYYTFQMPVMLAMKMCGISDQEKYRQANTILLEMGQFFQIQNDYLNCFGDPELTGQIGKDIMSGRCSWLAVVALQRANAKQKKVMEDYYGTNKEEDSEKIKSLYEDLGLPSTYRAYEEKTNEVIITHIQQITRGLRHEMFLDIMKKIYGRTS